MWPVTVKSNSTILEYGTTTFKFRASCLQSRASTALATPPVQIPEYIEVELKWGKFLVSPPEILNMEEVRHNCGVKCGVHLCVFECLCVKCVLKVEQQNDAGPRVLGQGYWLLMHSLFQNAVEKLGNLLYL
jgi:hypothetical protein